MYVLTIYISQNVIKNNEKQMFANAAEIQLETVTVVGTGKSIDFYRFVKVGYYPVLPLGYICI